MRQRCPEGDFYKWTVKHNTPLTLQDIYAIVWEFDCPNHGMQWTRSFQAEVKKVFTGRQGYLQDSVSSFWARLRKVPSQQKM
jgi:hypothetical protein